MGEKRDVLIQLRHARQKIEHAEAPLKRGGYVSDRELRDYIKAAISSLKTADSIITGEGKERDKFSVTPDSVTAFGIAIETADGKGKFLHGHKIREEGKDEN